MNKVDMKKKKECKHEYRVMLTNSISSVIKFYCVKCLQVKLKDTNDYE